METFGCEFIQVYGLTETTGAITQLDGVDHDPEGRPHLLRSCGKPYPWVEVRIVDNATGDDVDRRRGRRAVDPVAPEHGRLLEQRRGDGRGRHRRRLVPTGDAGYVDADGFLFLHDRVKDMIVSGGENVYPAEVENVLAKHPGVADVAVIGVPDDRWGEAVKAIVVAHDGASVTEDELIAFAREHLAGYKLPKSVDFAEELPRNPSGKLLKRELRAPYWAGATVRSAERPRERPCATATTASARKRTPVTGEPPPVAGSARGPAVGGAGAGAGAVSTRPGFVQRSMFCSSVYPV